MAPSIGGIGLTTRIGAKSTDLFQKRRTWEQSMVCSARRRFKSSLFKQTAWVVPDPGKVCHCPGHWGQDFKTGISTLEQWIRFFVFIRHPLLFFFIPSLAPVLCISVHHIDSEVWIEYRYCESHIYLKPGSLSSHIVTPWHLAKPSLMSPSVQWSKTTHFLGLLWNLKMTYTECLGHTEHSTNANLVLKR